MRFLLNWLVTSIAIAIAAFVVPGIEPYGAVPAWACFAFAGLLLGIVNALVKPILNVLALPITILTLGIFYLIINGLMLELASWLSLNLFGAGIVIASFGSAFFGAIVVSIASSLLGFLKE